MPTRQKRLKKTHPKGESKKVTKKSYKCPIELDTYAGKLHVEWDSEASVTAIGQLAFFIQYLKTGGRLEPFVDDCPLDYISNNAPEKIDVLGSLILSILS